MQMQAKEYQKTKLFLHKGQRNYSSSVADNARQISWTYVLHNTQALKSATLSFLQIKHNQLSLNLFGGVFFLVFCSA
jgi:cytochrome b involved in lipid metabolism